MNDGPKLRGRAVEFFTLRVAATARERIGAVDALKLRSRVDELRARTRAAEALWADDFRAEGLRMLGQTVVGLIEVLDAIGAVIGANGAGGVDALLRSGGAPSRSALGSLGAAAYADRTTDDAQVGVRGAQLFWESLAAARQVERALLPALSTASERASTRRRRWALSVGAPLVAIVAALTPLPTLPNDSVTASAVFSAAHPAGHATDGDPSTEWQTPDRTSAVLDVRFAPPRDIARLRLLNGHNGEFGDRAVQRARIEVRAQGHAPVVIEQAWPELDVDPEWVEHDVDLQGVDHIRVRVTAHHGAGAALAELQWE